MLNSACNQRLLVHKGVEKWKFFFYFYPMSDETAPDALSIIRNRLFINGKWVDGEEKDYLAVFEKYKGSPLAEVAMASPAQVEEAIKAAESGFVAMRPWSAQERADRLHKLAALLEGKQKEFARLIVAEAGKPAGYARAEVQRCIMTLRLSAEEALRFSGEVVPVDYLAGKGKQAFTRRFPVGPVACISPFNFPLNLALHKIGPALAVGCSVVLKPSPFAPLSALAFAALVAKIGYPPGAVNVIMAENEVAEALVTDPRMKMLSFTGSPGVGWMLKEKAGRKKVVLELGGNAAAIVDETADLMEAAKSLVKGAFLYAGQICISTQRIYVEEQAYRAFSQILKAETEGLVAGDPFREATTVGPLISRSHLHRVRDWVREAEEKGGKNIDRGKGFG